MTIISFKGIYCIPSQLSHEDCDVKNIAFLKNSAKSVCAEKIAETKSIIKNSKFFNELSADTDVFVSSSVGKINSKDPSRKFIGILSASFKDPYEMLKNKFATLNLVVKADTEDEVKSKLTDVANGLSDYEEIKDLHGDNDVVFLGDETVITYQDC